MSASTEKKNRQLAREQGMDRKAQAAQEQAEKKAKEKRRWAIGTVLVALLVAAILILNSGLMVNHTTAVSVGGEKYSPAVTNYHVASQYFSWANQYGSYASLLGLDTSAGLSGLAAQDCPLTDGGSWKDYFVDMAGKEMQQVQALCAYADANGITLTEEEIAEVETAIADTEAYAQLMGFTSTKSFYATNYGRGVTAEIVRQESLRGALANKVLTQYNDSLSYSEAELKEEYKSFNGDSDVFDYSYFYATGEGAEETAKAILAAYDAGEGEDSEARLDAAIGDKGSAVHQDRISGSALSGAYKSWLMEQSKAGTATMVPGSSDDYYVIVFRGRDDNHYNMANVRHILVKAEASEDGTYSEEAKKAAKAEAEEILAQWKAGEATEDSFAELANTLSEDGGSNTNGGLYENVIKGQMVEEFDAFCFGGHKAGDTAVVYGESSSYAGYHVMYFVGEGELYSNFLARTSLATAALEDFLSEQTQGLEIKTGFGSRFIG